MNVACGNSEHSLHSGCYLNLIIKQPIFEKDRLRQSGKEVWELLRSPEKQLYGWSGGERCWKYRPGSKDRKAGSQTEKLDVLLWAIEGLPRGMWPCARHQICLFCIVNAFSEERSLLIFVLVTGTFWLQGNKSLLKRFSFNLHSQWTQKKTCVSCGLSEDESTGVKAGFGPLSV